MRYEAYLGIDPGKSGGIALVTEDSAEAHKIPPTNLDLFNLITSLVEGKNTFAVIEKVHSSPQMGVRSAFTFGQGKGALLMALAVNTQLNQLIYEEVTPRKWQQSLSCLSGGDKNVTKERAQRLFPKIKITHAIADALLIAEYAKRTY